MVVREGAAPVPDVAANHAEGVVWDPAAQRLFVDIPSGRAFEHKAHSRAPVCIYRARPGVRGKPAVPFHLTVTTHREARP